MQHLDLMGLRTAPAPDKLTQPRRFREEGVVNLWRGVGPNVARNAIINAAELASYDQAGAVPPTIT